MARSQVIWADFRQFRLDPFGVGTTSGMTAIHIDELVELLWGLTAKLPARACTGT